MTKKEIDKCKKAMLHIWLGFDLTALTFYAMRRHIEEGSEEWNRILSILKQGPDHPDFDRVAGEVLRAWEEADMLHWGKEIPRALAEGKGVSIVRQPYGAFLIRVRRLEVLDRETRRVVNFADFLSASEPGVVEDLRKDIAEREERLTRLREELRRLREELSLMRRRAGPYAVIPPGMLRSMIESHEILIERTERDIRSLEEELRDLRRRLAVTTRALRVFDDMKEFMDFLLENVPTDEIDLWIPSKVDAIKGFVPAGWEELGLPIGLVANYDAWVGTGPGNLTSVEFYRDAVRVPEEAYGPVRPPTMPPGGPMAIIIYPRRGVPEEAEEFERLKKRMIMDRLRPLGLELYMTNGGGPMRPLAYLDVDNAQSLRELESEMSKHVRSCLKGLRTRLDIYESTPGNFHIEVYVPRDARTPWPQVEKLLNHPMVDDSFRRMSLNEETTIIRLSPKGGRERKYISSLSLGGDEDAGSN